MVSSGTDRGGIAFAVTFRSILRNSLVCIDYYVSFSFNIAFFWEMAEKRIIGGSVFIVRGGALLPQGNPNPTFCTLGIV